MVDESSCAIFQNLDVMVGKLSVVRLEAENSLAVHAFKAVKYQMEQYYIG